MVPWMSCRRLQGGGGGKSLKEQRRALIEFTEAPVRQGAVESPWDQWVGGASLGEETEAQRILKKAGGDRKEQTSARRVERLTRPSWEERVRATEEFLGGSWKEMNRRHGDWGRNGLLAASTRPLGWRLADVVRSVPGMSYGAAAQGIRRFLELTLDRPKMQSFVKTIAAKTSKGQV